MDAVYPYYHQRRKEGDALRSYYQEHLCTVYQGDALLVLKDIPDGSIDMCMTSPPYWGLRDYHLDHQLGVEPSFYLYIDHLMQIFDEIKRVVKAEGTVWVNIADGYCGSTSQHKGALSQGHNSIISKGTYAAVPEFGRKERTENLIVSGIPPKSLIGIPERFVIAMSDHQWIRRNTIIWWKRNPMPESVKDRFTEDFEYLYMFSKQGKYIFEQQFENYQSIENHDLRDKSSEKYDGTGLFSKGGRDYYSRGSRNKRCVWDIPTKPSESDHYAAYPDKLCETPILAGCPADGTVLDPFAGTGTTGAVAKRLGRKSILIELSPKYCDIIKKRVSNISMPMDLSI